MSPASYEHEAPRQLLAYTFPPEADYGGQLMGALQRIESGGSMRIVEALFVGRDPAGELVAVSLRSDSPAGMIGQLIGFRLEESERKEHTENALAGPAGELVRALAAELKPGHGVAGLLVEHAWAQVLADTVARVGGTPLASELIAAADTDEAWQRLPAELARSGA